VFTSADAASEGDGERARVLAVLRARASDAPDVAGVLERLCEISVEVLGLSGAVISLMTVASGTREGQVVAISAASSAEARGVEELEFSLGEGPGKDAFLGARPVLTPDLHREIGRWPGYAAAAIAAGTRATFAFPLHVGATCFGALHLHCSRARSLTDQETSTSLLLAELATEIVLDALSADGDLDPGVLPLLEVVDHHDLVYQAQGMVMVQLGVSLPEALARMRAHAYASDQTLAHLAADILSGRTRLTRDREGPQ
jgi:hypothetical protein